jgi:hypothetical protein
MDAEIAARLAAANRQVELPADLLDRVEESIRADERRRAGGWINRWSSSALAAAAMIALALTARMATLPSTPPGPSPDPLADAISSPTLHPEVQVDFEVDSPYFARLVPTTSTDVSIAFVYRGVNARTAAGPTTDDPSLPPDAPAASPAAPTGGQT